MPVFEAKTLESDLEGLAFLAAVLHPSHDERVRALTHGRCRADCAAAMADPMTIEPRYPIVPSDIEAVIPLA
ncbi:hypothetical protein [Methylobacterium iners]|uniref:Uncharacterized protein n=1 Tax=Methylobacterium iners TaxID=418707 RepID=A0ABQ4RZ86_9HYPH|nr:hypothetical protein [Methylobacterium iners]GJD94994.1 hypothetical protein OCOJLMKI_2202 [Methylobacterium iners]